MALFSRKKKTAVPVERVLEFNSNNIKREMEHLSSKLYPLRKEFSLAIVKEVVELARNAQLLEINRYRTIEELSLHRGRLQAFSDLADYLDRAMTNKPAEEKAGRTPDQPRDTLRTRPPKHGTAGAAI